jgi:hypothetical protein
LHADSLFCPSGYRDYLGAAGKSVVDSAGRHADIPNTVRRVFATGHLAATFLYVLAPHTMIGWVHAPDEAAKAFLLPRVRSMDAYFLPRTGHLALPMRRRQ